MNAIRVLLYKAFLRYVHNRTALALTFAVPIAMIAIFGQVFGLNRKDSGPNGVRLAVVNQNTAPAMARLVEALQGEKAFNVITTKRGANGADVPLTESDLRPMIEAGAFRFALLLPPATNGGLGVALKFLSNPQNEIEAQTVNGLLQKTIFTHVPELLGAALQGKARELIGADRLGTFNDSLARAIAAAFGGSPDEIREEIDRGDFGLSRLRNAQGASNASSGGGNDFFSRLIRIDTEQVVGRNVKSPAATRVVGGWAIMFLMFALNGSATSLFDERKSGMFQRLLAAPVTRGQILWSRFIFGVALGLVQLVTVFFVGSALYGIEVANHLGNLAVVSIAAAAACTALGLLIASVSSTQESAMGLATFVVLTMSACGGAWFPISFMPEFMQQIAKFTVTYWAMEGFADVLWAGKSLLAVLPRVGVLVGIAGGLMALAVWRFDRGRLFD